MKKYRRGDIRLLVLLTLFLVGLCGLTRVQAQDQTVFVVCTWDTSSIFKGKDGREKFERRFYVSNTVSMSKEDFLQIDREGDRIEGLCGDYLEKTVIMAAADRGERVDTSGQLRVLRNIELSGENIGSGKNMYSFATKETIEKKRDAAIKEMLDANRFIMRFNWDVTGKTEAADLANERKRVVPTPAAKP